jgi:hypothetical protein
MMRLFLCGLVLVAFVGCSSSHRPSSAARPTAIASTAATLHARLNHGLRYGTITGCYYSDGGPPPLGTVPRAHPIIGIISVTNAESRETYQPREDARGCFTVVAPVGTYDVMAESRGGVAAAMTDTVTVTEGKTVNADLGIHVP